MCMDCDGGGRDPRRNEDEETSQVEQQETATAARNEGASMAPSTWPEPTEREEEDEEDRLGEEMDVGAHMGYLQISDEPLGQTREEGSAALGHSDSSPLMNGEPVNASNGGGALSLGGAVLSNGQHPQERIVVVNGMEFHMFGNVTGLELLGNNTNNHEEDLDIPDSEEEEEEERRRVAVERAIVEAHAADEARRAAPIPPEHRTRIVNAMKGITLGGFRPSWADSVPEDQWITKIKDNAKSVDN